MGKRNAGVLAPYEGKRPPAPPWFDWAIAQAPERSHIDVDGVPIELLTWGARDKPGLLFLHGDSAHADWWSFIAPFFMADWRCAAISWSGMGSSGRRPSYSFDDWATEAIAAVAAAGFDAAAPVMVVAHSLGGHPALIASARCDRIGGVVVLDSAIIPKHLMADVSIPVPRPHRTYASIEEALGRFRFIPPTVGDKHYAVDHVARLGLHAVEGGWTWRFDPEIWRDIEARDQLRKERLPREAGCSLAFVVGGASTLIGADVEEFLRGLYPPGTPFISIPEAGHHIMVDQPLATIAALRSCLAFWPKGPTNEA